MSDTRQRVKETYERLGGNASATARELNLARGSVNYHLRKLGLSKRPMIDGTVSGLQAETRPLPKKGNVKRYIVSSAQNNTKLNEAVWTNLMALAEHYDAEVLIGTYTYNKQAYGKLSVKKDSKKNETTDHEVWYDERIHPYIADKRIGIAPGLVWCGEMNILPTARRPLTGFETYTGRKSGIFPHVKFAMDSIAALKDQPTKFNYTTGTVTQKNYLQKRAGLAAEHSHGYGGLVVEVDSKGRWFVRQLNADATGRIYDLDVVAEGGEVFEGQVAAITWGDIHSLMLDPRVRELSWGKGGILDTLRPEFQFFHDIMFGTITNHHGWGNPHNLFDLHVRGWGTLANEFEHASQFMNEATRDWCTSVVVWSNHDSPWIEKWLRETDYRRDPANAELFLELQLRKYRAIRERDHSFNILEHGLRSRGCPEDVEFLGEDESFTVCGGQIECGLHGHLGTNGSKGTPMALSRMGRRANTAHTHSAGIVDGLCVAGTSTRERMGYNKGPSSASQSHIVTYPNAKRAIITLWDGRWRA